MKNPKWQRRGVVCALSFSLCLLAAQAQAATSFSKFYPFVANVANGAMNLGSDTLKITLDGTNGVLQLQ